MEARLLSYCRAMAHVADAYQLASDRTSGIYIEAIDGAPKFKRFLLQETRNLAHPGRRSTTGLIIFGALFCIY